MVRGLDKSLIQVYTGSGKGKTTAALGLALRAVGRDLKVYMIQFMKGMEYGELKAAKKLPNLTIEQFGRREFVDPKKPTKKDRELAARALAKAKEVIESERYDVVILDEINVSIKYKLIEVEDLVKLLVKKPAKVELVLTGRYAPSELVKRADLVTEMLEIKHPYRQGIECREGIDY